MEARRPPTHSLTRTRMASGDYKTRRPLAEKSRFRSRENSLLFILAPSRATSKAIKRCETIMQITTRRSDLQSSSRNGFSTLMQLASVAFRQRRAINSTFHSLAKETSGEKNLQNDKQNHEVAALGFLPSPSLLRNSICLLN